MIKLKIAIALVQLSLVTSIASASEGFFPLAKLPSAAIQNAFLSFPEGNDCGATRIHDQKRIFITALHCIRAAIEPDGYTELGNPINPESLVLYDDHSGTKLMIQNMKFTILANGSCWTGFGLDVISGLSSAERERAIECLQGDWVIFELQSPSPANSCMNAKFQFASGDQLVTAGGPRLSVQRSIGMTKLDGRVYSTGQLHDLDSLLASPSYPASVTPLWESLKASFTKLNGDFILSDADIINGMSGGPITVNDSLIGVSTVGLLPNNLFNFPELTPIVDGYNFGIHGGVSLKQLKAANPKVAQYFHCP
jgi:hypothetical protein